MAKKNYSSTKDICVSTDEKSILFSKTKGEYIMSNYSDCYYEANKDEFER